MSTPRYRPGDVVVLKSGTLRNTPGEQSCRIMAVLPEAAGVHQYRVQFDGEGFERHVSEGDIDAAASKASTPAQAADLETGTSWIKPDALKIRK